jgi:hypothetical protein
MKIVYITTGSFIVVTAWIALNAPKVNFAMNVWTAKIVTTAIPAKCVNKQ